MRVEFEKKMKRSSVTDDNDGGDSGDGRLIGTNGGDGPPPCQTHVQPAANKIRLLLHAVDGCVPFLNPAQLETHFPPPPPRKLAGEDDDGSDDDDVLWIGLSVRDTCVVPVFDDVIRSEQKKSNTKSQKKTMKGETAHQHRDVKKARGYTFSHSTQPDPWLMPYTRVTVPVFVDNSSNTTDDDSAHQNASVSNTDQHVCVWTPHGRQKLTPEAYSQASKSLDSHFTVPLYDWISPPKNNSSEDPEQQQQQQQQQQKHRDKQSKKFEKDIERAIARNQQWFGHLHDSWETVTDDSRNARTLWSPVLLSPSNALSSIDNSGDDGREDHISTNLLQASHDNETNYKDVVSGVAFIGGWTPGVIPQYFSSATRSHDDGQQQQNQQLEPQWRAVLTTSSLNEIIGIVSEGYVNVIGTSLPTQWAKDKKALGLDLSSYHTSPNTGDGKSAKRIKLDSNGDNDRGNNPDQHPQQQSQLDCDGCMDMNDKTLYELDTSSLVKGCTCMVCHNNTFSRAYIHHLVRAKELLAEILIFAHNLHHLLQVIRTYNNVAAATDSDYDEHRRRRDELTTFFRDQLGPK